MQPVIIQDTVAIGAGLTNQNLIASNPALKGLQRLPFAAKLTLAMVQSAPGLIVEFNCGADNGVDSSNPRVSASTPEIPLDVVTSEFYGHEGDLLVLKAVNPTGGSISIRYMIIAEAIAMPGEAVALPPQVRVIQQGPIVVANGSIAQQLLEGTRYERPSVPSLVDFLMTQSATGLLREIYIDMERIAPPSTISLANRVPQDPFDATVQNVEVDADKEIQLQVTNQSGGGLSVFFKMVLRELVSRG